jgi:uncharacterized RDD family membrane protein YckC
MSAPAGPAQDLPRQFLAGDERAVWLVRPSDDGQGFDVLLRRSNETWKALARGLSGRVALTAAVEGSLHVIFKDPLGYGLFQMDSPAMVPMATPSNPQWAPGTLPLALCAADRIGNIAKPTLVAVVPRNVSHGILANASSGSRTESRPVLPAPASQESRPAGSLPAWAPARWVCLDTFVLVEGKWELLTGEMTQLRDVRSAHTGSFKESPYGDTTSRAGSRAATSASADVSSPCLLYDTDRVLMAAADGKLYRMIFGPQREVNELAVWEPLPEPAKPGSFGWRDVPIEGDMATATPIAMLCFANKLAVVAASPVGTGKAQLNLMLMEDKDRFSQNTLDLDKKPYTWEWSSPPMVAGMGQQFELVWSRDGKLLDSKCTYNGALTEPAEIPISKGDSQGRAYEALNYFVGAVFLLTLVLLALRAPVQPKPFTLPPQIAAGNLIRRALAAFLDIMPWTILALAVFQLKPEDLKGPISELVTEEKPIYVHMLSMSLYLVYCIIMEMYVGATVGKMVFRLRVVGDEGQRPDVRAIALRNLMKVMEMLPIPLFVVPVSLPLLLAFPLVSHYRQRIGDVMARTTVADSRPRPVPPSPPPTDDEPQ